jgi:hypothetical protein
MCVESEQWEEEPQQQQFDEEPQYLAVEQGKLLSPPACSI